MSKEDYLFIFKKVGCNIRKFREAKKLSQEELACAINSARNYIGCIERAEKFPSVVILYKIAKALDVRISDIMDGL